VSNYPTAYLKTAKLPYKGNAPMPGCTKDQQREITEVFHSLNVYEEDFIARVGSQKDLCILLHSLRRWYTGSGSAATRRISKYLPALATVMDLSPPVNRAYRGFKVPRDSELALANVGDIIKLNVTRNKGISSWTTDRAITNRFSGKSKDRVGIIIKLKKPDNVKVLIAPPAYTKPWFDDLYGKTMGKSFRYKEHEYVLSGSPFYVEVVAVKK